MRPWNGQPHTRRRNGIAIPEVCDAGESCLIGSGTLVPFPGIVPRVTFINEQFWGRAARASGDSQESGRPFNSLRLKLPGRAAQKIQRRYFPIHAASPSTRPRIACSTSSRLAPGLRSSFALSA
jgi:hypothetical protein